jgi:tetratricopeptide (TPR) repeat protein
MATLEASGPCPTPDQVAAFIQGSGAPAATAAFELHLDACARCRELTSALCRADSAMNAHAASSSHVTRVRSSPDAEAAQLAPGSSIGRYTVLGLLGAGGMGVVYAAYDPELDRKVALKIVHTDVVDADHRARVQDRLLYEARAMAQLSHPNVVAVHDLGRTGDRVFVAMELVEGQTLKRWLAEEHRGWREIVAAFVAAGQGLAAAHVAGLVHRDFKPANVLVGRDGRVRVTDFGLAQTGVPASGAAATADLATCQTIDARSGLVGTPYFMAPEQFRREPADARTDQFSFCVALYHALYRQHPFPGATLAELSEAVTAGCLRPAPTAPRAPRWVARAILRGLSSEPEHRHRSMEDLLRALQRDPHRRLRRGVVAALAGAIAVALAVVPRATVSRPSCADDVGRMAATWNPEVRQRVQQAFLAGGKAYAPAAFAEVARMLDGYQRSWTDMRLEVCEAARTVPAQASELVGLRSLCLDGRLSQMRGLVRAFTSVSGDSVQQAARAAHELPDVSSCADPRTLLGVAPPPADPVARATIAAVHDQLSDAQALFNMGRYPQALERVRPLVDQARATHYRPLEADVLYLRGTSEHLTARFQDALVTLKDAVLAAEAGRSDAVAVRALLTIMYIEFKQNGHVEQAEREIAPRVRSILERMGGSDELEGKLHVALSLQAREAHRYDQAVAEAKLALERLERHFSRDDFGITAALQAGFVAAYAHGDGQAALETVERLLAIRTRVLGNEHPEIARTSRYLGDALVMTGRLADARAAYDRALTVFERTLGRDYAEVSDVLVSLAECTSANGQFAEALGYLRRSQAIVAKVTGRSHVIYGRALLRIAEVQNHMTRDADALATLREAEPIVLATAGDSSLEMSDLRLTRGQVLTRLGRVDAAREDVEASLAILDRILGPGAPASAYHHCALGHIYLATGQPRPALASFERALPLLDRQDARLFQIRADVVFSIARVLTALNEDPAGAHELAESARETLAALPALKDSLQEIDAWLARHPGPRGRTTR